jgi:hypothetical protein
MPRPSVGIRADGLRLLHSILDGCFGIPCRENGCGLVFHPTVDPNASTRLGLETAMIDMSFPWGSSHPQIFQPTYLTATFDKSGISCVPTCLLPRQDQGHGLSIQGPVIIDSLHMLALVVLGK